MKLCSKCERNPRRGTNSWCLVCDAAADRARYAVSPIIDKTCRVCKGVFRARARKTNLCQNCHNLKRRTAYADNTNGFRDKAIAANIPEVKRIQKLRRDYGLTEEQVGTMLYLQECKCAICRIDLTAPENRKGQPETTYAIDHDHVTGDVRGILCMKCNKALGGFRDDAGLLTRASEYISASL